MIIVHLSDFHLNQENLSDWNEYIKDALVALIKDSVSTEDNLFILCTGDLIDKGGRAYNGAKNAFDKFKKEVIIPLVDKAGITIDRFIIAPGNHDIDRNADDEITNDGLRSQFSSASEGVQKLNNYAQSILSKDDKRYTKRMIPFKEFERELYQDFPNVDCSFLGSIFQFNCNGKKICFNSLNTSWLAYDDKDKDYGVAVSEPQYNQFKDVLKESDVKIALMHHPIDWLKYEKNTISKWLFSDYDIMTVGHVHETDTSIITRLSGTMFINVAPCFTNNIRADRKSFANGVTIIDYDPVARHIVCKYYIFNLTARKYVLNTDIEGGGVLDKIIPSQTTNTIEGVIEHALEYIKGVYYPKINEGMIPQKANAISELKSAYVHIPITQHADEEHKLIELASILNNSQNQLFFGAGESGKTILLYRLLMEYIDEFHVYNIVPVYINFYELGNKEVSTVIREFVDCKSTEVRELVKAKRIILLVDNYNCHEEFKYQSERLYKFVKDNEIRIIATANNVLSRVIPDHFIDQNKIAFEFYHLEQFKTENIKQLMIRWSPNDEFHTRNNKIERMVSNFCSYSLPCTAMSVSLYLWSTENANREPVNQAVLLDIYIEIILEKLSKENVYHNTFDYKNKTMLLAYIAKAMLDERNWALSYGQYIDMIDGYLEKVGFKTFDSTKLGDYFIERKIFTKRDNNITFAHSCFYYFFLARRMEDDKTFYEQVVNHEHFYEYARVIDYYAGLVRKDDHLLNFIYEEFKNYFAPAQPIYNEIDAEDFFTNVVEENKDFIPLSEKIDVKDIVKNKPNEAAVEKRIQEVSDERLSKITDEINRITHLTPDQFLVIMSSLLRNLDGTESVELKTEIYSEIVRDAIIYSIAIKNRLAIYANTHDGQLPECYNDVHNVELFLQFIPYMVQSSLHGFMGTTKLCKVFENKLRRDFKEGKGDIEKFFSLGMLWDTNSLANTNDMKRLIKSVGKNIANDYIAFKLYTCYILKVKSGSREEEEYLSLMSILKSRQYSMPFLRRKFIHENLKKTKEEREKNNKISS